eukprot:CAMPEP_0184498922 /NCGR_PEP_ID=MMETSP0113_2-20130426/40210_1 /TAXON_ID=91329 /ORGANISM="Norrisiella sphaerica, Strain BC52" /LENGTH=1124 /DNA_ID=CAMNT_0026886647 /DNA_START=83 /DNA_END=3457 /DNA_ORIENTATION=+
MMQSPQRSFGEFKNTMDYLLRETEKHLDYKAKGSRKDSLIIHSRIGESIESGPIMSDLLRVRSTKPHISAPPTTPIKEAWYEKPTANVMANTSVNCDIRLDKLESDAAAFRERIVEDLESAFKNTIKRIETMREDMLRNIRSNANDLEAQTKLVVANTVEDHNQREIEFRQRILNQLSQVKREAENRSHEHAVNMDRVSQKLGHLDADLKQFQSSVSSFNSHDFSQIAARIEENHIKINSLTREEKNRSSSNADAIERLQQSVDRLSADVRTLQNAQRSQSELQIITFDEKVRQIVDMQKKRQEAIEEQMEKRFQELRKHTELNLLAAIRDLSEENVRVNANLVELHGLLDENLAHQRKVEESNKIEQELLQKEVHDRVGHLASVVENLSKGAETSNMQSQVALSTAKKAEMGREVDRKAVSSALAEITKQAEQIGDCRLKINECRRELKGDIDSQSRKSNDLERNFESHRTKSTREASKIERELQNFEQAILNKFTTLAAALEAMKDDIKGTQRMSADYHDDVMTKVRALDNAVKSKLDTKETSLDKSRSLQKEVTQSIELLEARIASLSNNLAASVDASVSTALQAQANKSTASIDERFENTKKRFSKITTTLKERIDTLQAKVADTYDKIEDAKLKSTSADAMTVSDIEHRLQSIRNQIGAIKDEEKVKFARHKEQVESNMQRALSRTFNEKLARGEKLELELQRSIQILNHKVSILDQSVHSNNKQLGADRDKLEYCSRMIFTYGVQIIKESDVRAILKDITDKLCSRVAKLETHNGFQTHNDAVSLATVANHEKELDNFNRWLAETHNITPNTHFHPPSKGSVNGILQENRRLGSDGYGSVIEDLKLPSFDEMPNSLIDTSYMNNTVDRPVTRESRLDHSFQVGRNASCLEDNQELRLNSNRDVAVEERKTGGSLPCCPSDAVSEKSEQAHTLEEECKTKITRSLETDGRVSETHILIREENEETLKKEIGEDETVNSHRYKDRETPSKPLEEKIEEEKKLIRASMTKESKPDTPEVGHAASIHTEGAKNTGISMSPKEGAFSDWDEDEGENIEDQHQSPNNDGLKKPETKGEVSETLHLPTVPVVHGSEASQEAHKDDEFSDNSFDAGNEDEDDGELF